MADRVLSIEIGQRLTKVVETELKAQKAEIFKSFIFETPDDTLDSLLVRPSQKFKEELTALIQKNDIKTKKIVFVIPSMGIPSKEEQMPLLKENQLRDFIKTNASGFFPVDLEKYQIVHRINGQGDAGKQRVQLYAISNDMIASYERLAALLEMELVAVQIMDDGIAKAIAKNCPTGTVANITIEEGSSIITVVKDGEIALQRSVAYGVSDAVTTCMDGDYYDTKGSFLGTLEAMSQNACVYESTSEIGSLKSEVCEAVTEELRYLIGNISRMLDYYVSQNQGEGYDKIYVSGLGVMIPSIMKLIKNDIDYDLVDVDDTLVPKTMEFMSGPEKGFYLAPTLAVLDPIGIKLSSEEKKKAGLDLESVDTAKKFFILICAISFILIAVVVGQMIALNVKTKNLENNIEKLSEAKKINDEYVSTKAEYDEVQAMIKETEAANDELVALFEAIEKAIPSDTRIKSFTSDETGITIDCNSPNKTVVAATLQALRNIDLITDVSLSESSSNSSDSDETVSTGYEYSITCTFASKAAAAAEAEAAATEEAADASNSEEVTE